MTIATKKKNKDERETEKIAFPIVKKISRPWRGDLKILECEILC